MIEISHMVNASMRCGMAVLQISDHIVDTIHIHNTSVNYFYLTVIRFCENYLISYFLNVTIYCWKRNDM